MKFKGRTCIWYSNYHQSLCIPVNMIGWKNSIFRGQLLLLKTPDDRAILRLHVSVELELVFVKHYVPNCLTLLDQHCLPMTVTTVQIQCIWDFNVILSKGNNSKIGDTWDKKKIWVTYFFMRNQNMKFQNISIHGSKLMLYTIKQLH